MIKVLCVSVHVRSCYLLAVVRCILHTQQVGVGPSIEVGVFSANLTVPSVAWLALAAEHGLGEDAQVDAVCILIAVVATVFARVSRCANLKENRKKNLKQCL